MKDQSDHSKLQKRQPNRTRRYIFLTIVLLVLGLAATQAFLHQTSVGNPRFIRMIFLLYTGTTIVVLAIIILAAILGRNLVKLYFEKKSGKAGSRFRTRIVRIFIVLSLLPAVLLFLLSYGLISSQIDQWFQAPLARMMEHSRLLAESYYNEAERNSKYFAANIAGYVQVTERFQDGGQDALQQKLKEFLHQYNIDRIQVFKSNESPFVGAGSSPATTEEHRESVMRLVHDTVEERKSKFLVTRLDPMDPYKEVSWATAPVYDTENDVAGVVLTETLNDQSAGYSSGEVLQAYEKYEQLQQEKNTLRFNTIMILGLSTLLIVFAFSWVALFLAKKITVPIQALEQGAAAVAAGNLSYRVQSEAFDEFAGLIASFNRMTMDLEENERNIKQTQQSLRQTNLKLDDRRRYIETILQTIATGVISLDKHRGIRTMNRAAMEMLQIDELPADATLEDILMAPACGVVHGLLAKAEVLGRVVRNINLTFAGKSLQLAIIATPLQDGKGEHVGWVLVLDDVTELLRMEKLTAWQEVARRLAHEIKNPLTPIQLSAERVLQRYKQLGKPPDNVREAWRNELEKFDALIEDCIQTIIQEAASLKEMVDEFSRFARLPEIKLVDTDLHAIMDLALSLYDGRIRDVEIVKDYDPDMPSLKLDPEQMKRVFVNLFDNALEAMAGNDSHKELILRTRLKIRDRKVIVEVGDTGKGFPREYQGSLFLPYFSGREGGTGLGLAIVRQIVSDHNGNVHAEANIPEGTKIVIDLPLAAV